MNIAKPLLSALIFSLLGAQAAMADSTLEFLLRETGTASGKPQSVLIKNGMLLVKGAGGDDHLDLLYSRPKERLTIIDHRKKTIMPVDEQQVRAINRQTEDLMPLLHGIGSQVAKLSPKQRAKWEEMLGGQVSLDKLADASKPQKPTSIVKTGVGKSIAGFSCEEMNVVQGKVTMAEFCLASPDNLNLPADDYATIRSLFNFSGNLAAKTRRLTEQFGVKIPLIDINEIAGIPVEMRDLSGEKLGSLTLQRIMTSAVSDESMRIPRDYHAKSLALWK